MAYTTGDTVKFRLKSGEIQKGDVVFIERSRLGNMVYINGLKNVSSRHSTIRLHWRDFRNTLPPASPAGLLVPE